MFKNNGRKKMRLEKDQIEVLKNKLSELSSNAKLYLFGSRIDDTKKGGDIDLLVVSDKLSKKDLRYLRIEFFKYFGEQKLDIILDNGKFQNPFIKYILPKAVLL
jgi:predicted nucleotidyltransferase